MRKNKKNAKKQEILNAITEIRDKINLLNNNYNYVVEKEAIDCCIYERLWLNAKYTYYLNLFKRENINAG